MALTSWGSRVASEPLSRTEERAAGVGPLDNLLSENGKHLDVADNGVTATKLATWRITHGTRPHNNGA